MNAMRHKHGTVIPAQETGRFLFIFHCLDTCKSGHASEETAAKEKAAAEKKKAAMGEAHSK